MDELRPWRYAHRIPRGPPDVYGIQKGVNRTMHIVHPEGDRTMCGLFRDWMCKSNSIRWYRLNVGVPDNAWLCRQCDSANLPEKYRRFETYYEEIKDRV